MPKLNVRRLIRGRMLDRDQFRILVQPYSLLRARTLNQLYYFGQDIEERQVPGAVVECGVFRGGSAAMLLYSTKPDRHVWLCDSFQGSGALTESDTDDEKLRKRYGESALGINSCSREHVRVFLTRGLGFHKSRITFVEGWLSDTLKTIRNTIGPISLLHIDVDWYEPTLETLNQLYDQVSPGGWIEIDDYYSWEGCRRAVNQFFKNRKHPVFGGVAKAIYMRKS